MAKKSTTSNDRKIQLNKKKKGRARKKFSGKDQKPKRYVGQGR